MDPLRDWRGDELPASFCSTYSHSVASSPHRRAGAGAGAAPPLLGSHAAPALAAPQTPFLGGSGAAASARRSELVATRAEVEALQRASAEAEEDLEVALTELQALRHECADAAAARAAAERAAGTAGMETDALRAGLEALRGRSREGALMRARAVGAEREAAAATAELAAARAAAEALAAEAAEAKVTVEEGAARLAAAEEVRLVLERQLAETDAALSAQVARGDDLSVRLSESEAELSQLRGVEQAFRTRLAEQDAEASRMHQRAEADQRERADLRGALHRQQADNLRLAASCDAAALDLETQRRDATDVRNQMGEVMHRLRVRTASPPPPSAEEKAAEAQRQRQLQQRERERERDAQQHNVEGLLQRVALLEKENADLSTLHRQTKTSYVEQQHQQQHERRVADLEAQVASAAAHAEGERQNAFSLREDLARLAATLSSQQQAAAASASAAAAAATAATPPPPPAPLPPAQPLRPPRRSPTPPRVRQARPALSPPPAGGGGGGAAPRALSSPLSLSPMRRRQVDRRRDLDSAVRGADAAAAAAAGGGWRLSAASPLQSPRPTMHAEASLAVRDPGMVAMLGAGVGGVGGVAFSPPFSPPVAAGGVSGGGVLCEQMLNQLNAPVAGSGGMTSPQRPGSPDMMSCSSVSPSRRR